MIGKLHTFAGETGTLAYHGRRFNVDPKVLYRRVNRLGWSLDRAIHTSCHGNSSHLSALDQTKTRREWADALGVSPECIKSRLRRGWTPDEAVSVPAKTQIMRSKHEVVYEWKGKEYNISELVSAATIDISHEQMRRRIAVYGWSVEKAMTTPVRLHRRKSKSK